MQMFQNDRPHSDKSERKWLFVWLGESGTNMIEQAYPLEIPFFVRIR
jgi:hypothetical protein